MAQRSSQPHLETTSTNLQLLQLVFLLDIPEGNLLLEPNEYLRQSLVRSQVA